MSDWSLRNPNAGPQRNADAVLRASGACSAELTISPAQGDSTDAGQLGLDSPNFLYLSIAPVVLRKARPLMQDGAPARYELLISASAVAQQVSLLDLESAEALFRLVAAVSVAGLQFMVEEWACSASLGAPYIYRLLLRTATSASLSKQG